MRNHDIVLKIKLMWCLGVVGLGINYSDFRVFVLIRLFKRSPTCSLVCTPGTALSCVPSWLLLAGVSVMLGDGPGSVGNLSLVHGFWDEWECFPLPPSMAKIGHLQTNFCLWNLLAPCACISVCDLSACVILHQLMQRKYFWMEKPLTGSVHPLSTLCSFGHHSVKSTSSC